MQLFYRIKGNPTKPPLIILHGLWGASDNWLSVADLLAGQFQVILPDFRNHGNSPHSPVHDYESLSNDIREFIYQLHLPCKPFIAGHSMGGKTLMYLLQKNPEIAAKAIIMDICPKEYLQEENHFHYNLLKIIDKISLSAYTDRTSLNAALQQVCPQKDLYQLILKNIRRKAGRFEWKINPDGLRQNLPGISGWPHLSDICPIPVLFLKGEYSDYIQSGDLPLIRQYFPTASLKVIPQSTHWLHTDQPICLARAISDYFLSPES